MTVATDASCAQGQQSPRAAVSPQACLVAMLACCLFIYGAAHTFAAEHQAWLSGAPAHLAAQVLAGSGMSCSLAGNEAVEVSVRAALVSDVHNGACLCAV